MLLLSQASETKLHQVNDTLGEISNVEWRLRLCLPEKSNPEYMGFGLILAFNCCHLKSLMYSMKRRKFQVILSRKTNSGKSLLSATDSMWVG